MNAPEFIYKVAPQELVEASRARGVFLGAPVDREDGYIHFSTAEQLRDTLRLYFAGQSNLLVLAVRADLPGIRWEPSRGGALFPHLYGDLPMSAVVESAHIDAGSDGSVTLPDWIA